MLSFEPDFTDNDLANEMQRQFNDLHDDAAETMFETGMQLVDRAREKTASEGSFNNITWNLRGSIGCILVHNGGISDDHLYFPQVSKGEEGVATGIAFAREIALLTDDGDTTLVFVAGMDYALYVQAKGIDVIDTSTLLFESVFKTLFI